MNKYITFLIILFSLIACESLEDTYDEYANNGEIRYLGRCSEILVKPGWNRLVVSWKNSPDPVVDKIKLVWSRDTVENVCMLDRGITEYSIDNLEDGNYEITLCSVSKKGETSLKNTGYGRPYTAKHEMVESFTRIISNHYFLKNRLVLFFQGWEDNVEGAYLEYTKKDGELGKTVLTKELVNKLYYLLPEEIDSEKSVKLYRRGHLVGCEDIIDFDPMLLEDNKLFNADFKLEMQRQYGFSGDIPEEWASQVEELHLDWTIGSFSDLLNLPNLKKLVLGKNRYIREELVDDEATAQSKVYETEMSDFVLKTLHELNGLTVQRYNKHYSSLRKMDFIEEMGLTSEPADINYVDLSKYTFRCDPEDRPGYFSYLSNLTDGNYTTDWEPASQTQLTTYTLQLDLKTSVSLQGLKLVQIYSTNQNKRSWCPKMVKIYVSEDTDTWEKATYVDEIPLGNSMGEVNIIPFTKGGKQARFVRLELSTPYSNPTYHISLAEIGLY